MTNTYPALRHNVAVTLAVASLLAMGTPALAQDQTLVEAQQRINDEAAEAAAAGNYERAELLLRSSLALEDLDIIWLNLGRVYQKSGRCQDAHDAYQSALRAPAAEGVPEGMIAERVSKWSTELTESCPGTLVVNCSDDNVKVTVGDDPVPCGQAVDLPPGEYTVTGTRGGARHAHVARIQALKTTSVLLAPRPPPTTPAPTVTQGGPERPQGDSSWIAWTVGGAGVAALVAGTAIHLGSRDEYDQLKEISRGRPESHEQYNALKSEVETADAASAALWIGGGALLVASSALLYWEW